MKIVVAGLQMAVSPDVQENREAILRGMAWASGVGADILLTPEGSLSGYRPDFDPDAVRQALEEVTGAAREQGLGLALGTCFRESDGQCYNQVRFYEKDGVFLGFHSKILRCGTLEDPPKGELNHYACTPLHAFPFQGVTIGGLICNDLWANPGCTPVPDPHLSRQLANRGVRVIFQAVNGGRSGGEWSRVAWRYHDSNLRMRARASKIWIVTVDNCAPTDLPCSCPSGVVDPGGSWRRQTRAQGEDRFIHTIDLSETA